MNNSSQFVKYPLRVSHLFAVLCIIFMSSFCFIANISRGIAQTIAPSYQKNNLPTHQIYLLQPARSLQQLQYIKGDAIDGELTPDGMRILLKNYNEKEGVAVKLIYENGESSEAIHYSPCVIDPIPPY